ncbi:MAG: tetratricopeptide repeat protein, partial [Paracoccaceae bacterium]
MRRFHPLVLWTALILAPIPTMADVATGLAAFEKGDIAAAAQAFQAAFDAGDADGAFYLGRMFETGQGATQNTAQAIALYKTAVEGGSALAMNRMGLLHLEGNGVIRDFAEGAELLCRAADLRDADAQFNCGILLTEGRG